jgi:hypothetical protein
MAVSRGESYKKSRIRIVYIPELKCKCVLVSDGTQRFVLDPAVEGSGDLDYGMYYFDGSLARKGLRLPTLEEAQLILDNLERIDELIKNVGGSPLSHLPFWIGDEGPSEDKGYIFRYYEISECPKNKVVSFRCVLDF